MEMWKDIKGYEGWYQVSNLGRVKRLKKIHCNHGKTNIVEREYILKGSPDRKGYLVVILNDGIVKKHIKIHRLVAEAFIDNPYDKPQVDHINRVVSDNRVSNLRWVNNSENQYNTRRNVLIEAFGKSKSLYEWSKETGISETTLRARIYNLGWCPEKALSTEINVKYRRQK